MPKVKITKPQDGDEFELNTPITVEGTADVGVVTISLYSPYRGTSYPLDQSVVIREGKWSTTVTFNIGGQREIIAEGLGADNNSLDFEPDEVAILISTGLIKPVRVGRVSSPFGWRNGRMHKGVDIANRRGTPVYAIADGKVTYVEKNCIEGSAGCGGGFGNHIDIQHPSLDLLSRYAHLQTVEVDSGTQVSRGQPIGTMGSTGRSTGPHLHFEIRRNGVALNPEDFINPIV